MHWALLDTPKYALKPIFEVFFTPYAGRIAAGHAARAVAVLAYASLPLCQNGHHMGTCPFELAVDHGRLRVFQPRYIGMATAHIMQDLDAYRR